MRIQTALLAITLAISGLVAACVQSQTVSTDQAAVEPSEPAETKKVELGSPITTIKPGASVTINADTAGPFAVGENGSITLTVNEGYPSGTLLLEASGDDGLNVFGAQSTLQVDMSSGTTHTWRVNVSADADGVYYLNLRASAEPDVGVSESRAHSVRVEIGEWQTAAKPVVTKKQTLPSGEPAVIMEAEETIE